MRKLLITLGLLLITAPLLFARVDNHTLEPIVVDWSNDGIKIYNTGNAGVAVNAIDLYVVGGATTSAATYTITADTLTITTVGGLYPGTTNFDLDAAAVDTVTELVAFMLALSATAVGSEGGIVCSTPTAAVGKILSDALTAIAATNCLGSGNEVTITATPEASQTSTVQVCTSSMVFVTTNGLYPGTKYYTFTSSTETLSDLETALEAISGTDAGIDGGLVVTIDNGTYDLNLSTDLTNIAAQNILLEANEVTLDLDTSYGMSYVMPLGISRNHQWHITGINVNATFGSGTTYLKVYDGTETTDTNLLKYEIDTTATETPILSIPSNGNLAGGKETRLRIDVIGTAAITAGHITIMGYKE